MKKVKFKPGDTSYRSRTESESPFSIRNRVLATHDRRTNAKAVTVSERFYELYFANEKETYRSRNQFQRSGDQTLARDPNYQRDDQLVGNERQIRFSLSKLINHILTRLEENPQNLFVEASMIRQVCLEEGLEIQNFDAFDRISNWQEFIELLHSIAESTDQFKFELLIAAIVQYSSLCAPK